MAHARTDPALVSHLDFMSGVKRPAGSSPSQKNPRRGRPGRIRRRPRAISRRRVPARTAHSLKRIRPLCPRSKLTRARSAHGGERGLRTRLRAPDRHSHSDYRASGSGRFRCRCSGASTAPALHASVRPADTGRQGGLPPASTSPTCSANSSTNSKKKFRTANEDPETHYNLGSPSAKWVCSTKPSANCKKSFKRRSRPHVPATHADLHLAGPVFPRQRIPEAAIRWYDKALQLPTLDQETRTALHYELAASYESAQNRDAALKHFMEVYGSNIDYRDVGERIKALRS